mmetsp:Transcript_6041/g.25561  ORF Transcript_6041/g.25561 Transcript_6041/m.25561 type:complete len:248 (-) Transcript_6041:780-1523(-)
MPDPCSSESNIDVSDSLKFSTEAPPPIEIFCRTLRPKESFSAARSCVMNKSVKKPLSECTPFKDSTPFTIISSTVVFDIWALVMLSAPPMTTSLKVVVIDMTSSTRASINSRAVFMKFFTKVSFDRLTLPENIISRITLSISFILLTTTMSENFASPMSEPAIVPDSTLCGFSKLSFMRIDFSTTILSNRPSSSAFHMWITPSLNSKTLADKALWYVIFETVECFNLYRFRFTGLVKITFEISTLSL